MICKLLGALGASVVLYLAPVAAQPAAPAEPAIPVEPAIPAEPAVPAEPSVPADAPARPSFDVDIRAPEQVRSLLERHLELLRYREVSDLDDAELARLISLTERDVRELVATLGYFSPEVAISREPGPRPVIVVAVDPGPAATVSDVAIDFEGDIARTSDADAVRQRDEIRSGWRLPVGRPFTQASWDDAKAQAVRQLVARRYPAGRMSYSLADIEAPARAHLGLRLDSGPLFRLGAMQVSGVERYDPVLVPRLARLPPGSIYDQQRILEAQLRLASSGYFDSAFILVDPESDPNAAPLQVTVREAPLQKYVLGVGLTTDSGPRLSVEHTHNRMPLLGWRAVTKLQVDRKAPSAQTEWTAIPDERGWRWNTLARVERLDDGNLITNGRRLRFGRLRNEENIDRNVYVQYDRATVQTEAGAPVTSSDSGAGSALSVNYVWTGRYFDNVTAPSRGYGLGLELGGGVTLAGDRNLFQRTVFRWLGLRPLREGRLQLRTELGAVLARSSARVPGTQMFRTGGDTTVRGYAYRAIGVDLPGGQVGPGRYEAVGSVEWQRPIRRDGLPTNFESVLFVDTGGVSDRPSQLKFSTGLGAGVRWKSPVGPVEAALAWGVKPRKLRLHMSVGFVF
ncbi:MAG TPA: BamA/TamA family outer membrane protein [Ramlibacter sp.]|nr:BamA/TamA family outer membrane protein [Ramlibacter sp.]